MNIIKFNDITNIQEIITSLIESKGLDVSDCEAKTLQDGSKWIRIFHHAHKNNTVWFTNYIEALSCSNPDKFSKLYLLDHFRRNDGKYEFMLEYPVEFPNQIIRWKQTNNPWRDYTGTAGSTAVAGYEPVQVDIADSYNHGKGLVRHNQAYNSNSPCLLKGCPGIGDWWYAIGQAAIYETGMPGPNNVVVSIVDLWVRIDNTEYDKLNDIDTEITGYVKKPDIQKLQDAIHFLETKFNQNCCQSNYCQTCQSDKCESCQDACTCQSNKCEKCQEACTCQSNKCEKCQEACAQCSNKCEKCQEACTCQSQCSNETCQATCAQSH